ncbi:MAG: thiamine phosphate synthase [Pseudomonadota bacterium]
MLRYNGPMHMRQTLMPRQWLLTDARTELVLDESLRRLPRGSGVIFRHYHLAPAARRAAFGRILRICRARGLVAVLAAPARHAVRWSADGAYGSPAELSRGPRTLRLCTAHSLGELGAAARSRADAVLLSPVFPTRSHPHVRPLGPVRFLTLARRSRVPVFALGGVTGRSAGRLAGAGWAAIDGLARKRP